jgi:hypothetical protein
MYNRVVLYRVFAPLNGVRRLEDGPFLVDFVPTTTTTTGVVAALEKAPALQNAAHNFVQQGLFLERLDGGKVFIAILVHEFCVVVGGHRCNENEKRVENTRYHDNEATTTAQTHI